MGFFTSKKATPITGKTKGKAEARGRDRSGKETKRAVKGHNKPNRGKPLKSGWS